MEGGLNFFEFFKTILEKGIGVGAVFINYPDQSSLKTRFLKPIDNPEKLHTFLKTTEEVICQDLNLRSTKLTARFFKMIDFTRIYFT